ncbi:hypothetical protein PB1E_1580 [Leuconostoc gelidum subsp. gasicomitatum]|nr:hypothetical protein PB1E_1580 [Leuconostoc gasicomitatum]
MKKTIGKLITNGFLYYSLLLILTKINIMMQMTTRIKFMLTSGTSYT